MNKRKRIERLIIIKNKAKYWKTICRISKEINKIRGSITEQEFNELKGENPMTFDEFRIKNNIGY